MIAIDIYYYEVLDCVGFEMEKVDEVGLGGRFVGFK
jgi:hypothetical protein